MRRTRRAGFATRVAPPVRRRLTGPTPPDHSPLKATRRANPVFYPMRATRLGSGATRTSLHCAVGGAGRDGAKAVRTRSRGLGPSGSFNLSRRGEFARGDTRDRGSSASASWANLRRQKAQPQQGGNSLPDSSIRRRSRTGKALTLHGYGGASGSCPRKSRAA